MLKLSLSDISTLESGMHRPECVLSTKSDDLFCSDSRSGYDIVTPDGSHTFIGVNLHIVCEGSLSRDDIQTFRSTPARVRAAPQWYRYRNQGSAGPPRYVGQGRVPASAHRVAARLSC